MSQEIEYKYLVDVHKLAPNLLGCIKVPITQGYLSLDPDRTIRVRVYGENACITIKGRSHIDLSGARSCKEYEYAIPMKDALELLDISQGYIIKKERFYIPFEKHIWEIDFFSGEHQGLIIAECEIKYGDEVILPPWVTIDVTDKKEYLNSYLSTRKYT